MQYSNNTTFGIVGNFEGDEELLKELNWCCQAFAAKDTPKPPLARLVDLLEALPSKGSIAVVHECLVHSPHRDAILRDLFDYCFLQGSYDDSSMSDSDLDEFVWISNPSADETPRPLNLAKHHLFKVVLALMSVSGAAGAEASRKYLSMASSKFRGPVLVQCAKYFHDDLYSDEELFEQYQLSSVAVQNRLVAACKRSKHRKKFLQRVFAADQQKGDAELVYWLNHDDFEQALPTHVWPPGKPPLRPIKHWGRHGDAYLQELRSRLQAHPGDSLKQGKIYQSFRSMMELNSVQPQHVQAILQILKEFPLHHGQASLLLEAHEYLQNLSSQGQDVSDFEGIQPIRIDLALLKKLPRKERKKHVLQCIQQDDFSAFENVYQLVPLHLLPYQDFFAKATPQDFASILWPSSNNPPNPFLDFFCRQKDALFRGAANGVERASVVQSWCQWHLRCLEPSVTNHADGLVSDVCCDWYAGYLHFFTHTTVNHALKLLTSSPWDRRVPAYAEYAQILLGLAVQGMQALSNRGDTITTIQPLLNLLEKMPHVSESNNAMIQSLTTKTVQVVSNVVLPELDSMMQFNAAKFDTYITVSTIKYFETTFHRLLRRWSASPKVLQVAAKTILAVHHRAKHRPKEHAKFAVASPPKKKRKLVFYNYHLHETVQKTCDQLARRVLEAAREFPAFDETEKLWNLVSDSGNYLSEDNFNEYLMACSTCLPKALLKAEESTMITRAESFILQMVRKYPSNWKDYVALDTSLWPELVEKVVAHSNDISEKVGEVLIKENAGFGNSQARQSLKDETFVADADSRIAGLLEWTSQAYSTRNIWHISNALTFAASRIKNEPGFRRRTFFGQLQVDFVTKTVQPSLEDASQKAHVHEKLAGTIISIQHNDLARLDSVARQVCFAGLPKAILDTVMQFDPTRLCLERRQIWANCAIKLHWDFRTAVGGEETLARYSWPLHRPGQLETSSWISLEEFQAVYPSDPSSDNTVRRLSDSVNLGSYLREKFDPKNVFGPAQCVSMLEQALNAVWLEDLPCCALRLRGCFPEDIEVAEALYERLLILFELCGTSWQESDLLASVFDSIFDNVGHSSHSQDNIHFASKLLSCLFTMHDRGNCHVPRLAQACDRIFRVSVAKGNHSIATEWLDCWMAIQLEHGDRAWDFPVGERMENFLYKYADGCEPGVWRKALSPTDLESRQCEAVSKLLGMSSSALYLPQVQETLLARRQDVLLRYLRNTDDLKGVFQSPDGDYETVDEMLFHDLGVEDLSNCHAEVSQRLARFACKAASDSKMDLTAKIDAISKFMKAPSTQHHDVLAALKNELEDAVREALINRVFDLDSPWFILGYLFCQDTIEKNDERVIAGLLGYIAQHVHAEKTDRLGAILLKDGRRDKLTVQLHKSVVRMLFDSNTTDASQMLQKEWSKKLPDSVRMLIVEKCVRVVAEGQAESWETSVLSQVAQSQSYGPELKYCLFAPCWQGFPVVHSPGGIAITTAEDVTPDDFLVEFGEKGPPTFQVTSPKAIEIFRSLVQELEESSKGPMQFLARLKKLSLSNLFSKTNPSDDQGVLDELAGYLKTAMDFSHQTQVGRSFCATLFGEGVLAVLTKDLWRGGFMGGSRTAEERRTRLMTHPTSKKFHECCRFLLNLALDLPIRQTKKRGFVLKTLNQLKNHLPSASMKKELFQTPFSNELVILGGDSVLTQALSSGYGRSF